MMQRQIDWPLDRNVIRRNSHRHTFGMVRRHADGSKRPHQGWDFEAEEGTECFSVADGEVVRVYDSKTYGHCVCIRFLHDYDDDGDEDELYAFYAHLSKSSVKQGDKVRVGELIGLTGNTGNARSMRGRDQHLHFEVRTKPWPRRGLKDRISPLNLFDHYPIRDPVFRLRSLRGANQAARE